jgi:sugar phosphate isomerase/epimerase
MEYARTGSDYLLALHVHDNDGEIDEHHPPFSGTIDWSAVLPVLAAAPRLVAITLELVYAGGPVTEAGVRGQLSDIAAISKRLKQGLAGSIE